MSRTAILLSVFLCIVLVSRSSFGQGKICSVNLSGTLCDGSQVDIGFQGTGSNDPEALGDAHQQADEWEEGNCFCSGENCSLTRTVGDCVDAITLTLTTANLASSVEIRCFTTRGQKLIGGGVDDTAAGEALDRALGEVGGELIEATRETREILRGTIWLAVTRGTVSQDDHYIVWEFVGFGMSAVDAENNRRGAIEDFRAEFSLGSDDIDESSKAPRRIPLSAARRLTVMGVEYANEDQSSRVTVGFLGQRGAKRQAEVKRAAHRIIKSRFDQFEQRIPRVVRKPQVTPAG